jgi:hypothetical protein
MSRITPLVIAPSQMILTANVVLLSENVGCACCIYAATFICVLYVFADNACDRYIDTLIRTLYYSYVEQNQAAL